MKAFYNELKNNRIKVNNQKKQNQKFLDFFSIWQRGAKLDLLSARLL